VVNSFVDGFAIADALTNNEFDLLASVPVRFENNGGDGTTTLWHTVPMFELKPEHRPRTTTSRDAAAAAAAGDATTSGDAATTTSDAANPEPPCRGSACLLAVRFSTKSGGYAPLYLGPETLKKFYAARRKFSALAHDSSMSVQLQLAPGDMAVFDNTRILHARSAVAPSDGGRFLQGCYTTIDGIHLNYERLRRQSNKAAAAGEDSSSCTANSN
jgi:gamma-butyrobetaine dioxygenase